MSRVGDRSPKVGDACLVLGGGLNFPAVGEGCLNVNTGRASLTDEGISAHLPASRLFWNAAARSAVRARSGGRLARAIERFPRLGVFPIVMIVLSLTLLVFTLWCAI